MRWTIPTLGALALALSPPAAEADPPPLGLVKVEVTGKLMRKDGRWQIEAHRPAFPDMKFYVELGRTEDKNQALDAHIAGLEGKVVTVTGLLDHIKVQALDGPELVVEVREIGQVRKANAP
jgi:hypothetical protein